MQERLQKVMAHAGVGSRRRCEEMISQGRVTVNDKRATLGQKVDPRRDDVMVDGKPIEREEKRYIMVYKPLDVLSSTEDELGEGRRTGARHGQSARSSLSRRPTRQKQHRIDVADQ